MKTLTVKLSDASASRIAKLARARKTTASAVVREALEKNLEGEDALADIADLIGAATGPRDLSSGRALKDGYGKD